MATFAYFVFGIRQIVPRKHLASFKAFKAFNVRIETKLDEVISVLNLTDAIYHSGCSLTKFERPDVKYDAMLGGKLRYINKESRIRLKASGINDTGVTYIGVPIRKEHITTDLLECQHIDQFAIDICINNTTNLVFAGVASLTLAGDSTYPKIHTFFTLAKDDGHPKYHPDQYVNPSVGNVFSFDKTIDGVTTPHYYFVVAITKDYIRYREIDNFDNDNFCWSIAHAHQTSHLVTVKPYLAWKNFTNDAYTIWNNPQVFRA